MRGGDNDGCCGKTDARSRSRKEDEERRIQLEASLLHLSMLYTWKLA
jgi:hypothetical protein